MSDLEVQLPPPLEAILVDLEKTLDAKLYYAGLVICLTLPEICCALTKETHEFVKGPDYRKFIETYARTEEIVISPMECYRLRGGVVHRGGSGFGQIDGYTHVLFTIPETNGSVHGVHMKNGRGDALTLDLVLFCSAMVRAVLRWYDANSENKKVARNLENLISRRTLDDWPIKMSGPIIGSGPL